MAYVVNVSSRPVIDRAEKSFTVAPSIAFGEMMDKAMIKSSKIVKKSAATGKLLVK